LKFPEFSFRKKKDICIKRCRKKLLSLDVMNGLSQSRRDLKFKWKSILEISAEVMHYLDFTGQ
ncbi:hypothetical protein, partial [Leptospira interrogans]|uniref:hypothetical protein n=1 Tax=Leptospira interrogans TaxID=173 RepID=UPI001292FE0A